jgi:hypothetical protein
MSDFLEYRPVYSAGKERGRGVENRLRRWEKRVDDAPSSASGSPAAIFS